jgi:hypothetical protein
VIDRANRDRLIETINRYLDESITAFEFDDEIDKIMCASADPTVTYVRTALWYYYDDCKDHKVVLSKEEWDYFQRLILLLRSDSHVETVARKMWSVRQVVATFALAGFGYCVSKVGIGSQLLVVAIPFGVISMLLSRWRRRRVVIPTKKEVSLVPFSSVPELRTVHRAVPDFCKRKYPSHLKTRSIRGPLLRFMTLLPSYIAWLLLSPVVLFVQLFPETEQKTFVRRLEPHDHRNRSFST